MVGSCAVGVRNSYQISMPDDSHSDKKGENVTTGTRCSKDSSAKTQIGRSITLSPSHPFTR